MIEWSSDTVCACATWYIALNQPTQQTQTNVVTTQYNIDYVDSNQDANILKQQKGIKTNKKQNTCI